MSEASISERSAGTDLAATLLRVAWLSILLGLVMEALMLIVLFATGSGPQMKPFVADLVQKVSWSTFVCIGLSVGTAAAKGVRAPAMALSGLVAAPAAFYAARALHQAATKALALAAAPAGPSPAVLAALKGVQYALLGLTIAWLGSKGAGAAAHVAAGLSSGFVFGGAVLALTLGAAPQPIPSAALLTRGLNELIFPAGCALVLFSADALGRRMRRS